MCFYTIDISALSPKTSIYGFNVLQNKQCTYPYIEIVSAMERQAGAVIILSSVLCYFCVLKHGNIKQWETKKV